MATAEQLSTLDQIGETAGMIWQYLSLQGPTAISRLVKEVDAPRDVVLQAIGWLGREDKIAIEESSRSKVVSLR